MSSKEVVYKGTLYVVATPIGNLQDITFRAIEVFKNVGAIVCEDTRVTSVLLQKFNIKKPLIAANEFNEEQIQYEVLKILETSDVALVSDAGTPLISDPGYRLVSSAKKRGIRVVPIPGASAVTAALSASGLPTDKFVSLGFLPKTKGKAVKLLERFGKLETTVVFFESPHRIIETLNLVKELFGDIEVTLGRELTKKFEEITTRSVSAHLEGFETKPPKGEFVILFK